MKAWTEITLWKRVMGGLALGLIVGLIMRYGLGLETSAPIADTWLKPFGDGFVRLIKMLVVPLIFTTLVAGVTAMGDPKKTQATMARRGSMSKAVTLKSAHSVSSSCRCQS